MSQEIFLKIKLRKFLQKCSTLEKIVISTPVLHSVSYFYFLYRSPSLSLCMVFDSVSSNTDEVLSINPSSNVFVFEDFNSYHKDWLTYCGGTLDSLRWLTFLLESLTVTFTVLLF